MLEIKVDIRSQLLHNQHKTMNLQRSDLEKYFKVLELLFDTLPYVFWKDAEGKYQGSNQNQALNLGFSGPADFIGKTIYEILDDQVSAHAIDAIDQKVMQEDKPLILEERMLTSQGEKYYHSQKSPIHDQDGKVIGLLGFSMDITDIKKQEIAVKEERDRLIKIAAQVAHDINSPLAALKMMIDLCDELPENKRSLLKRATESILDIANNLLASYSKEKKPITSDVEPRQSLLLSDLLIQLSSEKKMQYRDRPIQFDLNISKDAQFAFIQIQKTALRRSLSNLINNAVDALENKIGGLITVQLAADPSSVMVEIQDNGKGMSPELVKKLQLQQNFTEGKNHGHGLGLQQVQDMLEYNQGIMEVDSTLKIGTSIRLTFPRIVAADWLVQEIQLCKDSTVIILDDEDSIHGAWDIHFAALLALHPHLKLHHFRQGQEVINFLENLSAAEKESTVLLSDYELPHQEKNGLEIIKAVPIKSAILVTSHYANSKIQKAAMEIGIKIVPKQMISMIPIHVR